MKNYQQVKAAGTPYDSLIRSLSEQHGLSYDLFHKMIYLESKFDPNAKSPTGPIGIAQFTKATGKAYGLSSADRKDPTKSLTAAARHLADLSKSTGGDQALMMLGYNQGLGGTGRRQQEALKKGDLSGVSPEGLNYMRKLQDVFKPEQVGRYSIGGQEVQPKADPLVQPKAEPLVQPSIDPTVKPKEVTAPKAVGFQQAEAESGQPVRTPTYAEELQKSGQPVEDKGLFSGTGTAIVNELSNSTLGSGLRGLASGVSVDAIQDHYTSRWQSAYIFNDDDYKTLDESGLPATYLQAVSSASSSENLKELIGIAQQSFKNDQETAQQGTGAQIIGSVASAAVDPISYIPIMGQAAKGVQGARLLSTAAAKRYGSIAIQGGVAAGVSEYARGQIVGSDVDLGMAIAGGALFGAGLSALSDGVTGGLSRTVSRLEANESARNLGIDSEAMLPHVIADEAIPMQTIGGIEFKDNPVGDGSIVMKDGSILSADNPLNPKYRAEYAARGLQLGGMTDVSLKVLRSANDAIRGIGSKLFRSTTGLQSGKSGLESMVAADIHANRTALDRSFSNEFNRLSTAIADEARYTHGDIGKQAAYEQSWRRISDAIEKPEVYAQKLSANEKKLMEAINKQMDSKLDDLYNPSKFGLKEAKPLLEGSRQQGKYVPNVYDDTAKAAAISKFGSKAGLQQMIAKSWMVGYHSDPKVKARVQAMLKENHKGDTPLDPKSMDELAEKMAMDKAFGISNNSDFTYSAAVSDAGDNTGKGIGNNSFLDARHPFDSDVAVKAADGSDFRVNDLRSYRLDRILPQYNRRVNGDVSVMGSTGKTINDIKNEINATNYNSATDGNLRSEGEALMSGLTRLTGRSTREPDGVFSTLARSMTDASFVTKNAYMGIQNLTEVAGMVVKGHTAALLKGVPLMNKLMGGVMRKDPEAIKGLQSMMFGKEIDDALRPRRADIRDAVRRGSSAPNWAVTAAANLKYATGEIAARSPLTKALSGATNYIVDAARTGFLNDIVTSSLRGTKGIKPEILKSAAISDKQYRGIQSLIKQYIKEGADGKLAIEKGIMDDPRSFDLWRLGDHMANEAIQRSSSINSQTAKQYGAGVQMAMQFKSFVTRGVNSTFLKSYYEATKNDRAIEQLMMASVSIGLAGVYHMGSTYAKSTGMSAGDQERYLEKNLTPEMLAYAGITRARGLGAPLGIANIVGGTFGFDPARQVRSSILAKPEVEKGDRPQMYSSGADIAGSIGEQIPALGLIGSVGAAVHNATGLAAAKENSGEAQEYTTALFNSMKGLIPNDPVSQKLLLEYFKAQGISVK